MNLRYTMPRVRGRGAGLGNELIPWARAFLAAQMLGAQSLMPAFGLNSRRYWRHFATPRYDWLLHRALEHVLPVVEFAEADYLRHGGGDFVDAFGRFAAAEKLHQRSRYLLVTEGMWGGYGHVAAARDFVRATLYQSRFAAANLLRIEQRLDRQRIVVGMHVRLGDFGAAAPTLDAYRGAFNLALPLAWYRQIALSILDTLGEQAQFLIVSDGSAEQLKPLLDGLPAVTTGDLADSDCSDLLALAQADLLVCSVSSYSAWAAFLSDAPYLWFEPNLQRHEAGYYSIWGHEAAQCAPLGGTRRALEQSVATGAADDGRGIPVGIDGAVPAHLLKALAGQGRRAVHTDLVQYGVVPIRRAESSTPAASPVSR